VLAVARHGTIADAVLAARAGAFDYVALPLEDSPALAGAIERAVATAGRDARPPAGGRAGPALRGVITADRRMLAVCQTLGRVAESDVIVAIHGEAGTGRSLLASALHAASRRSLGPLVEVNCGALGQDQADGELFGVPPQKGAAGIEARGALECADGGTLVVGGLEGLAPRLTEALLSGAQSGEYCSPRTGRRLLSSVRLVLTGGPARPRYEGGDAAVPVQVCLPPLRDRVQDVPLLARHFLRVWAAARGRRAPQLSPEAMALLVRYGWPGNVRELKGVMERAAGMARRGLIGPGSLPEAVTAACRRRRRGTPRRGPASLKAAMRRPERQYILRALQSCDWSKQRAAELLKISRSTLYKKIREHGLAREIARGARSETRENDLEIGVGDRA
jgi:DNA-binding NtrC family response regulator